MCVVAGGNTRKSDFYFAKFSLKIHYMDVYYCLTVVALSEFVSCKNHGID